LEQRSVTDPTKIIGGTLDAHEFVMGQYRGCIIHCLVDAEF